VVAGVPALLSNETDADAVADAVVAHVDVVNLSVAVVVAAVALRFRIGNLHARVAPAVVAAAAERRRRARVAAAGGGRAAARIDRTGGVVPAGTRVGIGKAGYRDLGSARSESQT